MVPKVRVQPRVMVSAMLSVSEGSWEMEFGPEDAGASVAEAGVDVTVGRQTER